MAPQNETHKSFPQLRYPSLRDEGIKDAKQWLRGKALDDGAEGLWRIHNALYDLSDFIDKHPGGEDWIILTKGTDITEAFESHHLTSAPRSMLKKFYMRDAKTPRNSPFTFKEDGFYKTLRRRVIAELDKVPKNYASKSKRLIEMLAFGTFLFSILACTSSYYIVSVLSVLVAGILLACTTVSAHNFFHLRDNWRMYIFNLSFFSMREWRVTHVLSHHLYPNTLMDFEISTFEPILNWLPREDKVGITRYAQWFYSIVAYWFIFDMQLLKRIYRIIVDKDKLRADDFLPLSIPLAMWTFGSAPLKEVILLWLGVVHVASFTFSLIGVNAAHHHPDIFHDGDAPNKDTDWGIHQLEAVMERKEIKGSHVKVMISFGDHALHHLFPTLDHAVLPFFYPILDQTCQEFKTQLRITTQLDLLLGQFKQLTRNVPKR